jgi:hypothetical protein
MVVCDFGRYGRRRQRSVLRYSPSICLKELRETKTALKRTVNFIENRLR